MIVCVVRYISSKDLEPITNNSGFFDANGQCLDALFDEDNPDFELAFAKSFQKEIADNVNVLFVDKKDNSICGWYRNATLYMQTQHHMPTMRGFRAISKLHDTFLLAKMNRLKLPLVLPKFKDFLIAEENLSTELVAFIDAAQDTHRFVNLSLDISKENCHSDLDKKDVEQVFQQYQDTGDVFLLPSLYQRAIKWSLAEPKNVAPWDYLGFSMLELGRPQDALPHFEQALQIDSSHGSASCDKGECLIRLGCIDEAVRWLNEAIERIPKDDVRVHLSDAYLFAGFPSISYRLLKEIQSEEWQELLAPIIKEREKSMPYLLDANFNYSVLDAYPLFLDFTNEPLPEIYKHAYGLKRYIDPIRQRGILITPEETVRQRVISYLQNQIGIPKEAIFVEESLSHIDRELKERVDILIGQQQSGKRKFILLVECKAPGVALEGEPTTQLLQYNTILQAPFVLLTNGYISHLYHFNADTGEFEALRELPLYKEMCASVNIKFANLQPVQWIRPEYTSLSQPDIIKFYTCEGIIGEGSPKELAPFLLNLAFCLLDETNKVECPFTLSGCTIINDYGVIPMTTGNAGGGQFSGNYRWFGVFDRYDKRQNVYIGIFGTGTIPKESSQVIHTDYTTLYFAIEEKGKAISRLQIRLDNCLIPDGEGYRLTHSGVRSRGKIQPLIDFVEENAPELIGKQERIVCGWFDKTRNLYLSDHNVAQTIGNAISYLLLRSEYRRIEQKKKKKK